MHAAQVISGGCGAHRVVVRDLERLEVLDEAALQVARARRLHGRVHEALAARHTVEIKIGRAHPGEEAVGDVTTRARRELVRSKARRRAARGRERHTPPLELLLAEHDRDL